MREKFKQQLEENKTVTEESLIEMKNKFYHNGDEVKVGDKILFAMTIDKDNEDNVNLTMRMLSENQIDLYEPDESHGIHNTRIPTVKLK